MFHQSWQILIVNNKAQSLLQLFLSNLWGYISPRGQESIHQHQFSYKQPKPVPAKAAVGKPIPQTTSRTRVNVMGAIELASMNVVSCCPNYVNAQTTVAFFDQLKAAYPRAPILHIILDQSGYHRSLLVREEALKRNIVLHYLPPYSPNLNPIERLWKVMNDRVRNNVFFTSAKHFREAISEFFEILF